MKIGYNGLSKWHVLEFIKEKEDEGIEGVSVRIISNFFGTDSFVIYKKIKRLNEEDSLVKKIRKLNIWEGKRGRKMANVFILSDKARKILKDGGSNSFLWGNEIIEKKIRLSKEYIKNKYNRNFIDNLKEI